MRVRLNIVLVNPIAATPVLTTRAIVRPQLTSLARDSLLPGTNIVELGAALADLGHQTTVILGDLYLDEQALSLANGLRVIPVTTSLRFPFHPGLLPMTPALIGHPALHGADVIQTGEFHQPSTFFTCMAAREAGIPLVVWQETFGPMRFPGSWYQRAYETIVGRYVRDTRSRYVPRTTKAHTYLRELGISETDITPWIPTGIDLTTFAPRRSSYSPEDFGWKEDDRILLLVARLHHTKGVDVALCILKQLLRKDPDVRLVVRGSGPELVNLRRLAIELDVQEAVRFIGRLSREEMVNLYNVADVVLCTSRNDLLPFSLIEASSCGRPSVTRDVGAIRDIVVDGVTGLVVRDRSIGALGQGILLLLQDDEFRIALGVKARKRMEKHFSLPKVAENLLEVYRGACN